MSNFEAAKLFIQQSRQENNTSLCGPGSNIHNVSETLEIINRTIKNRNIKSILDLGCGDWEWMRYVDMQNATYVGWDADETMIQNNRDSFENDSVRFEVKDILTNELPKVDLIICRDVLFHIKICLGKELVQKIKKSCNFFISTSFRHVPKNTDIKPYDNVHSRDWGYYNINLNIEPFNLKLNEIDNVHEVKNSIHNPYKRYLCVYKFQ